MGSDLAKTQDYLDKTIEPLVSACSTADLAQLQHLLSDPHHQRVALSDRLVPYNRVTISMPVTRLMLEASCRTGNQATAAYTVDFAFENAISLSQLIGRDAIIAAIDSSAALGLFTEFVRVFPSVVKFNMGHVGDVLSYALGKDYYELVEYLLNNGADPNALAYSHRGPGFHLRSAAAHRPINIVNLLLEHGSQVSQSGAMQAAAERGDSEVLEALVKHGGDVNETLDPHVGFLGRPSSPKTIEKATETLLQISKRNGRDNAVKWLLDHGAKE